MANGRLRTMLAGLHLDLSPRRNRRSASPHHDAATATSRPRSAGRWLTLLADCLSDLRSNGRRRRSSWRVAPRTESCESKILLSGLSPFANMDMYYSVSKDSYTVAASGVLANDMDMESDPLTASLYSNATHGTVTLNSNGGFTYVPTLGYAGADSFQYRAYDGTSYSSATTVSLTVTNSWGVQTNAEDRVAAIADTFGSVAVVGYTGDAQTSAAVGDGLDLIYSSNTDSKPIIAVEVDFNGGTPTSLESILTFNGVASATAYYNTTGISGTTRLRFAQQADATSLVTGKYAWSMSLKAKYSDGSSSTRSFTGSSYVVNWNSNTEGDSWNLGDMDRLASVSGGMLWIRGDGAAALFSGTGPTYTSPAGPSAFSVLVQNTGGTYTLTDEYGSTTNFSSTGNVTSCVDSNSNSTAYAYVDADSDGQTDDLSTVTDPWGRVTTFVYSGGLLSTVTDHAGRVTTIGHDGQGRITTVTRPDPDGAGSLTSPVTTYGYSGTTRKLVTITDPLSHASTIAYDYVGLFDQITAADGGVQKLDPYQSRGIPASGTGTVGNPAIPYLPNATGNLYSVYTDQLNQVSKAIYNVFGQVTTTINPLGSTTTAVRNGNGLVTQLTLPDPDGAGMKFSPVWSYQYNTKGNLTQLSIGSDIQTWVYNSLSRATSHTDELSRGESWTYDTSGNMLTHTNKLAKVTTWVNNSRGQVTSITLPDPDGAGALTSPVTTVAYDSLGRPVTLTNPDSSTQTFTYNTADQMLTATDELGRVTTYTYDNLDRTKTVTLPDPDGAGALTSPVTTVVYNVGSLVTTVTDPKGYVTSYAYDNVDRLTQVTRPDPDGAGSLTSPVWQFAFNVAGLMTSQTDPLGAVTTYAYDAAQRQTTVTGADPDGAGSLTSPVTTYGYDALNQTITITDAMSRVTTLDYDSRNRLIKQTQPAGYMSSEPVTQWAYNAASELTSVTNAMGYVTGYAYDAMSHVTQVTQPDPDGAGALTSPVFGMTYDALGRNITQTDPLGNVTSLEYDSRSRLKKQTAPDPDGAGALTSPITQWAYDAASQMTSMTNALGYVTAQTFDNLGRVKQVTQPDPDGAGALTSPQINYTYDANSNVLTVADPLGNVTNYAYDNLNRLKTLTQPDPDGAGSLTSPVTTRNYDAANQVTSIVDPLGRTTSYVFDKLGRRTQTTLPDPDGAGSLTSPVINVAWNSVSRMTSVTDPLGNVTSYGYDNLDRITTVTQPDPDGAGSLSAATQSNQYDLLGRVTSHKASMANPDDVTSTYVYDNINRLIQMTQPDPDGAGSQTAPVSSYTYNANGNRITETNPLGKVTTWAFDNLNRLTQTTQPDPDGAGALTSPITKFGYDALNNRTSLTDPDNNVTTWAFDGLNRETTETNSLSQVRSFGYNAAGDLTSQTDRNGRVTNFTYDNLHRRTQEKWMSGSTVLNTFNYNFDSASQLTSASATGTQMAYTFDNLGRVLTASNAGTTNIPTTVQTNVYDANSRRTQQTATVASVADYKNTWTWDNASRQTQVKQEGQSGGISVAAKRVDFTYNTGGLFTGVKRYNDLAGTQIVANTTYTYDQLARLTALDHKNASGGNLSNYTWTFDNDGRITNFTNIDGYSDYTYDTNDQVTVVDHSYQTDESYTYDANGNRTNTGYTTSTNNRVTSDGTYNYTYDDEGNRISRTKISDSTKVEYTWDYRNRLTDVVFKTSGGTVTKKVQYQYDVFDRRLGKKIDATGDGTYETATYWVYDDAGKRDPNTRTALDDIVLEFTDADGDGSGAATLTTRYLHGPLFDQILASEASSGNVVTWALADHQGTVRDMVRYASGTTTVVNHRKFDAFGNLTAESDETVKFLYSYTGREWDGDAGLYYYRARWYDAKIGRFISEDRTGFRAGDMNLNRYVGNSTPNATDPTGLQELQLGNGSTVFVFQTPGDVLPDPGLSSPFVTPNIYNPQILDPGYLYTPFDPGTYKIDPMVFRPEPPDIPKVYAIVQNLNNGILGSDPVIYSVPVVMIAGAYFVNQNHVLTHIDVPSSKPVDYEPSPLINLTAQSNGGTIGFGSNYFNPWTNSVNVNGTFGVNLNYGQTSWVGSGTPFFNGLTFGIYQGLNLNNGNGTSSGFPWHLNGTELGITIGNKF